MLDERITLAKRRLLAYPTKANHKKLWRLLRIAGVAPEPVLHDQPQPDTIWLLRFFGNYSGYDSYFMGGPHHGIQEAVPNNKGIIAKHMHDPITAYDSLPGEVTTQEHIYHRRRFLLRSPAASFPNVSLGIYRVFAYIHEKLLPNIDDLVALLCDFIFDDQLGRLKKLAVEVPEDVETILRTARPTLTSGLAQGFRGRGFLDAGMVYAPYVPVYQTSTLGSSRSDMVDAIGLVPPQSR